MGFGACWVSEGGYNIPKRKKPTVNGNTLFDAFSRSGGALELKFHEIMFSSAKSVLDKTKKE